MPSVDWGELVAAYREGTVSRRELIRRATAAGISIGAATLLADRAAAQTAPSSPVASPTPAGPTATGGAPPGGRSITRAEYHALLRASFDLTEPETTGGRVIYGASIDVDSLHPHLVFDVLSGYIVSALYTPLVDINPTNGFPAPGLADFWELAEDGVTYTFHLNRDATWHDGAPITAEDVIFSFDAALDERSLTGIQSVLALALERYRAVDDHTVELVARQPMAVFVANSAALVGIVPRHIWGEMPPDAWGADPGATGRDPARVVGSGPFRLVERVAGSHVTLARNDAYWDPDAIPVIDEFIYRPLPETSSATAALITGEIDFARVPFGDVDALTDQGFDVVAYDDAGWTMLVMNQDPEHTDLFTDVRVRQALLYAIDRELMAEEIYRGYATPAHGTQPKLSIAHDESRIDTIYTYDPERAVELLEAAGWVDTDGDGIRERNGTRFRFELLFAETNATYRQELAYVQQAWREIGIDMTPVPQPFHVVIDAMDTGAFEMAITGISWGVDGSQGDIFRCDAVPPAGLNSARFCNPRYDALDRQQLAELDVDKRIDLLIEQTNIVNTEVAVGMLFFRQSVVASQPTLHNFLPNGYSFLWSMPWWWTELR